MTFWADVGFVYLITSMDFSSRSLFSLFLNLFSNDFHCLLHKQLIFLLCTWLPLMALALVPEQTVIPSHLSRLFMLYSILHIVGFWVKVCRKAHGVWELHEWEIQVTAQQSLLLSIVSLIIPNILPFFFFFFNSLVWVFLLLLNTKLMFSLNFLS